MWTQGTCREQGGQRIRRQRGEVRERVRSTPLHTLIARGYEVYADSEAQANGPMWEVGNKSSSPQQTHATLLGPQALGSK